MASVGVEFAAFLDPRFKLLADLSGLTRFDAIGRMAAVWVYCIEKTQETLPANLVDALADHEGYSTWIIEAGLGERLEDGTIRVRGTSGRIEWLEKARARQKRATEAAAAKKNGKEYPTLDPKSDPILDPKSAPSLVSSSASTSASVPTLKEEIHIFDFDTALAEYKRFPGVQKGPKAEKRFQEQITSEEEFNTLLTAIQNYRTFLSWPENSYRKPKTSFETFLGSKSSGFFWRDFIELPARAPNLGIASPMPLHMVRPV